MASDGCVIVKDHWLAGLLASLGCQEAEPAVEIHESESKEVSHMFMLRTSPDVRMSVVIGAWEYLKDGRFQEYCGLQKNAEDVELAELVNIYYCSLVMANRYKQAAHNNQKRVLRRDGKIKAILPAAYGPGTAKRYGLPYPPKPLTKQTA